VVVVLVIVEVTVDAVVVLVPDNVVSDTVVVVAVAVVAVAVVAVLVVVGKLQSALSKRVFWSQLRPPDATYPSLHECEHDAPDARVNGVPVACA
jgi:hypothetical protein